MSCTPRNVYLIVALLGFFINIIYSSKIGHEEGFLRMFCGLLCICLVSSCIHMMCDEQEYIAWFVSILCVALQVFAMIAMIRAIDKKDPNSETNSETKGETKN